MGWLYARIGQTCKEGLHVQVNLPSEEEPNAEADLSKVKEPYARVKLSSVKEANALVGLRTLLNGAQLEFHAMVRIYFKYLFLLADPYDDENEYFALKHPNIFQKFQLRNLDATLDQLLVANLRFLKTYVHPNKVKHSLANLGLEADVDFILDVVVALFEALKSPHSLGNFQAIVGQVLLELQGIRGANSDDQALAAPDLNLPANFPAAVYDSWVGEIAGNNATELCYYTSNLLAFRVIPRIIGQMLECDKDDRYERALDFAE
ncbi:hypothetical protein H4R34_002502 [Dimargaris verticillata]|uniref:Uncharacterized protein n=1 Tax=Dimargaris verticillata TaxID=2761393 RepID=A0A9W8B410_9FUNG|nr:hypothetical protein H4R34_002502 [Dimargaris verticillata]